MRSRLVIPVLMLSVILGYWLLRARRVNLSEAHISESRVTLWSSLAPVRQAVATLRYGQKVTVLERRGEQVHVRTSQGTKGWLEARLLMEPALWERRAQLLAQARAVPAQARGHTKVVSNVRAEPGRAAPRIYKFNRGVPVVVLARAVAEWPSSAEETKSAGGNSPGEEQKTRRQDWLYVRSLPSTGIAGGNNEGSAATDGQVEVAGWVLARFIELDLPGPIRDYASSSGMRVVAWFELNRVADKSGDKPQYLTVGARGEEGQPCDFTVMRVYTWGGRRKRYETAYRESNFCGRLPIHVAKAASGEPEFRFTVANQAGKEERVYRMRQTAVRRVRSSENSAKHETAKPRRVTR